MNEWGFACAFLRNAEPTQPKRQRQQKPASRQAERRKWQAIARSDGNDLDRAFFEIRLLGNRIGGVEGRFVDELAGVEPRHEYNAARRTIPATRLDPSPNLTASRYHPGLGTFIDSAGARAFGMHKAPRNAL
jgi:hypothetical protein